MLPLYSREVGFVISHAVVVMALGAVFPIQFCTVVKFLPRTCAGVWVDGKGGQVTGYVRKPLRTFEECSLRKWQHGWIVPVSVTYIRDLLDEYTPMLTGDLWEFAIL